MRQYCYITGQDGFTLWGHGNYKYSVARTGGTCETVLTLPEHTMEEALEIFNLHLELIEFYTAAMNASRKVKLPSRSRNRGTKR